MPASERYCAQLVQFFDQFPNWNFISDETKRQMVEFISRVARDDHEAHAAIQDLMENQTTGKVPTLSELRHWIEIQREGVSYQPPAREKPGCGYQNASAAHPDGGPTRCEDGWIFVVKRVIVKGRTEAEDYTYAGKCPRCHGTAWYAQQEGK